MKKKISTPKSQTNEVKDKSHWLIYLLLIPFLAILFNTCNFDFNFDDSLYINALPAKGAGFMEYLKVFQNRFVYGEYRQLSVFIIGMESFFFGDDPMIFHFFNCIFYLLNGFLMYKLSSLIFPNKNKIFWVVIALLYLFHPSHVEVFASIKNQESLLSNCFGLLFLICSVLYLEKRKLYFLLLAFLLLLFAVFCKRDAIVFMPLIMLISFFHLDKLPISKRLLILLGQIGFALFFFNFIVPSIIYQTSNEPVNAVVGIDLSENYLVGKSTILNRIGLGISTFYHYLAIKCIPTNYYFYYGANKIVATSFADPLILLGGFLLLAAIISLAFFTITKNKRWTIGPLLFLAGIAPYLNIYALVAGMVGVRYAYISSIGFVISIALLSQFISNNRAKNGQKWVSFERISFLILLIYLPYLYGESKQWKNIDTLLAADMPFLEKSVVANRVAAERKLAQAQLSGDINTQKMLIDESLKFSNKGLSEMRDAELLATLSKIQGMKGEKTNAISSLKEAYRLDTNKANTIYLLAVMYKNYEIYDSSIFYYQKYIKISPLEERVYTELNETQRQIKAYKSAFETNNLLKKVKPNSFVPFRDDGNTFLVMGDTVKAIKSYVIAFKKGYYEPNLKAQIFEYYNNNGDLKGKSALEKIN
ncbi:MAG: hypothetical protein IPH74_14755 [Bacteroidetes bacterium]|nr:hypothetical protein [Bacteroidota bacterium]